MLLESRENDSTEKVEEKAKKRRFELFKHFIPDLNERKEHILRLHPESEKDFSPFIVNRAMSMNLDSLMYANEMNQKAFLPKVMIYDFYLHGLKKKRRYGSWAKKSKIDNLELIMHAFQLSEEKSLELLELLSDNDIEQIKNEFDKGGKE
jgi:hypothetical protein